METSSALVGSDHIDLSLNGHDVRVISADDAVTAIVTHALADHIVERACPVGFAVAGPATSRSFFVVADRSGHTLGRTRAADHAADVVLGHLSGFLEPPDGTCVFRLRSVVGDDGSAIIALFPALVVPPVVERRLERAGYRLVDSLVSPISIDGPPVLHLPEPPWKVSESGGAITGHLGSTMGATYPLSALVVPSTENDDGISRAALVAWLGGEAAGESRRSEVLDAAAAMAQLRNVRYDYARPDEVYRELSLAQRA